MLVELGNAQPHDLTPDKTLPGPAVTYVRDVDLDDPAHTINPGRDVRDLAMHLAQNPGQVTKLPDDGLFVLVNAIWTTGMHGQGTPTWVHVETSPAEEDAHPGVGLELQRQLAEFWACPEGHPVDLEESHYTNNGAPGVGPAAEVN